MPSPNRTQRKIISLGSSLVLNKEGYDSGADSTPRAAKLSPATLSRHRAESSGYDSIVRDSETSSIASDSSRQTSALQEHHGTSFFTSFILPSSSIILLSDVFHPTSFSSSLTFQYAFIHSINAPHRLIKFHTTNWVSWGFNNVSLSFFVLCSSTGTEVEAILSLSIESWLKLIR